MQTTNLFIQAGGTKIDNFYTPSETKPVDERQQISGYGAI